MMLSISHNRGEEDSIAPPLSDGEPFAAIETQTPVTENRPSLTPAEPERIDPKAIAEGIRDRGDTIDLKRSINPTRIIGNLALLTAVLYGADSQFAYNHYPFLTSSAIAAIGVPYIFGSTAKGILRPRINKKKVLHQLEQFDALSDSLGESVEIFKGKKGLTLRWYGEKEESKESDSQRIEKISGLAHEIGASSVVVPEDIAKRGDGQELGKASSEKDWVKDEKNHFYRFRRKYQSKDQHKIAKSKADARSVVVFDIDQFDTWQARVAKEDESFQDSRLQMCIDRLRGLDGTGQLFSRLPEVIDISNPTHVQRVAKAFRLRIERDLHDTVRPTRPQVIGVDDGGEPYNPAKRVNLHGRLSHGLDHHDGDPKIAWQENGHLQASENLLKLMDRNLHNFEQLEAIIEGNDDKKAELAALILGYREALLLMVRRSSGLTTRGSRTGGSIVPLQESSSTVRPLEPQVDYALRFRISRFTGYVAAAVALVVGMSFVSDRNTDWRDSIYTNQTLIDAETKVVDEFISFSEDHGYLWLLEKLNIIPTEEEALQDFVRNRMENPDTADDQIGNVFDGPNHPIWTLHPHNGMSTEGFWISNVSSEMLIDSSGYGDWITQSPSIFDENREEFSRLELPSEPDSSQMEGQITRVERTLSSMVVTPRLLVPVLHGTELVAFSISNSDGEVAKTDLYQSENGSIYADVSYENTVEFEDGQYHISYWVVPSDEVTQRATNPVIVYPDNPYDSRPVHDLAGRWSEELGIEDPAFDDILAYLMDLEYRRAPFEDSRFYSEEEFVDRVISIQAANCNTANSALILSEPEVLNAASGFSSTNGDDFLSTRESHMAAVDYAGNIVDATPSAEGEEAAYFDEPVDTGPSNKFELPVVPMLGVGALVTALIARKKKAKIKSVVKGGAERSKQRTFDHVLKPDQLLNPELQTIKAILQDLRWNGGSNQPLSTTLGNGAAAIDVTASIDDSDLLDDIRYLVGTKEHAKELLERLSQAIDDGRASDIDSETLKNVERVIKHLRKTTPRS